MNEMIRAQKSYSTNDIYGNEWNDAVSMQKYQYMFVDQGDGEPAKMLSYPS